MINPYKIETTIVRVYYSLKHKYAFGIQIDY